MIKDTRETSDAVCVSVSSSPHPVISVIALLFRPHPHYTEETGKKKKEITGHFGKSRAGKSHYDHSH